MVGNRKIQKQINKVIEDLMDLEFAIHETVCNVLTSNLNPNAVERMQQVHNRWHELQVQLRHLQRLLDNPSYKNRDVTRSPCPKCGVWKNIPLNHGSSLEMCECPVFNQDN